jgi:hypothetical protein
LQEELAEVLAQRENLDRKAQAFTETIAALENLANIEALNPEAREAQEGDAK